MSFCLLKHLYLYLYLYIYNIYIYIYLCVRFTACTKYSTARFVLYAAEPFSEACCSACVVVFCHVHLAQAPHLRRYLPKHHWPTGSGLWPTLALLSWDQKLTSPAFLLRRAVLCQAWPHILALFAPLLWLHELLRLEGLHNLQLPANTKAI